MRPKTTLIVRTFAQLLCISSSIIITAGAVFAGSGYEGQENISASQEVSFVLTRQPENPRQYNLIISDSDERVVSGLFTLDQLQILRSVMVEAEKFGLTEESVNGKPDVTTRFMDKEEKSFVVDVQKVGTRSRFFFTLQTDNGLATWEAGRITRTTRREEGFFFDLLSRLESILPKPQTMPPKPKP